MSILELINDYNQLMNGNNVSFIQDVLFGPLNLVNYIENGVIKLNQIEKQNAFSQKDIIKLSGKQRHNQENRNKVKKELNINLLQNVQQQKLIEFFKQMDRKQTVQMLIHSINILIQYLNHYQLEQMESKLRLDNLARKVMQYYMVYSEGELAVKVLEMVRLVILFNRAIDCNSFI